MKDTRKSELEKQNKAMINLVKHCHYRHLTEEALDRCNIALRAILIDNGIISEKSFPPPPKDPAGGKNP